MPAYVDIPDSVLQPGQFITSAIGFAFRDNVLAINEGDGNTYPNTFPGGTRTDANDYRVLIPDAVRTDELDTSKVLVPDGTGQAAWGTVPSGAADGQHEVINLGIGDNTIEVSISTTGTWVGIVSGGQGGSGSPADSVVHGHCIVVNNAITFQRSLFVSDSLNQIDSFNNSFSLQGGGTILRFTTTSIYGGTNTGELSMLSIPV